MSESHNESPFTITIPLTPSLMHFCSRNQTSNSTDQLINLMKPLKEYAIVSMAWISGPFVINLKILNIHILVIVDSMGKYIHKNVHVVN